MTNMILFGALLARRPLVQVATVEEILIEKLGARKAHLQEANLRALARGLELGVAQHA